jgi:spore germination cell wall hydrolase CwlJ-like protein
MKPEIGYSNMGTLEYLTGCFALAGIAWIFTMYPDTLAKHQVEVAPMSHIVPEWKSEALSLTQKKEWCKKSSECMSLARTGYFEARGEPLIGVVSVMHVVMNRVNDSRWPDTIKEVVNYRCQFSYKCDHSEKHGIKDKKSFDKMLAASYDVMNGLVGSPIQNANHYFAPKKANPYWANKLEYVADVGDHKFYKW